jgi:AraC-like DNA-binding protein
VYREHSPGAALSRWVECCWTFESPVAPDHIAPDHAAPDHAAVEHAVRPDGCLDIVYSLELGLRAVGAMPVERRFRMSAGMAVAGVRFRPGLARQFLLAPPVELTGRLEPLEQLWGRRARELESRLSGSPSAEERTRLLLSALLHNDAPVDSPGAIGRAMESIAAAHGVLDLDWAAAQANLSARQFRRRCLEESGLTPKHLCRVLRFRRSLELAASRRLSWAAIAAETGYFDQAHLIRDFREFTGKTPMAVFSNTGNARAGKNRT